MERVSSKSDTGELRKILDWSENYGAQMERIHNAPNKNKLKTYLKEFSSHQDSLRDKLGEISTNTSNTQNKESEIANNKLLVNDKGFLAKLKNILSTVRIKKELKDLKKEKEALEKQKSNIEGQMEELKQKIISGFSENGAKELAKEMFERVDYYCGEVSILNIFDFFYLEFPESFPNASTLTSIPFYLNNFKKDLLSYSRIVKDMSKSYKVMQEKKDLGYVLASIRMSFSRSDAETHDGFSLYLRGEDVKPDGFMHKNEFWQNIPKASEVPEQYQKLVERFPGILDEKDETEFIKKCADFHFDFIQLHPFMDGNGRTARMLLSLMLASHNYLLPALYDFIGEKDAFYINSNSAVHGDYKPIRSMLFARIKKFNDIKIPEEYKQFSNQKEGIESEKSEE